MIDIDDLIYTLNEPRCEKNGLRDFRPGPTQSGCTVIEDS